MEMETEVAQLADPHSVSRNFGSNNTMATHVEKHFIAQRKIVRPPWAVALPCIKHCATL